MSHAHSPINNNNSGRGAVIQINTVPRNSKGGVEVKDEDIEMAFEFFGHDSGTITAQALKSAFLALNKTLTKKELKTIFDGKDSITIQEVKDLLKENTIVMDPIIEAFNILDPTNNGFIGEERLKKIFSNLGYGELTEEELVLLVETGGGRDGKLGLEDFRKLVRPDNHGSPGEAFAKEEIEMPLSKVIKTPTMEKNNRKKR